MTFEKHVRWIFSGEEVEDLDHMSVAGGKQMSSVTEPYLATSFVLKFFVRYDFITEDVAHPKLSWKTDYDVETTWMQTYSRWLLVKLLTDLKRAFDVVPNSHRFVSATCGY